MSDSTDQLVTCTSGVDGRCSCSELKDFDVFIGRGLICIEMPSARDCPMEQVSRHRNSWESIGTDRVLERVTGRH
ncbi:hypothetical protein EVAR_102109_1 [Eumeta japonica]|uniref:Uncharacterized protein n=1 Tax=Eumeta variegata TaxID=151549 RepID=A0A4C1TZP4_EUMVA|nr:hypothetical protein EVAR_102109_1 [Eumeta japonica]